MKSKLLNKDFISNVLWGNRKQFGLIPDTEDPDWKIWQEKAYSDFYKNTQQRGIGGMVNRMAYHVIERIDFGEKQILEIGPGIIRHLRYIKNKPVNSIGCFPLFQLKNGGEFPVTRI